jgi:hypothetical protein
MKNYHINKFLIGVLIFVCSIVILFNYFNLLGSTYKFGIRIKNYKGQIAQIPNYYPINNKVNEYSWNTPIILPDSKLKLKIEHLVEVNCSDKKLNPEIGDDNYLMTMIEPDSGRLISVIVENFVDGNKLDETVTKLYRNSRMVNKAWSVSAPLHPDSLNIEEPFLAIAKVYRFPKQLGFKILGIESFLFNKGLQKITIKYFNSAMEIKRFYVEFEIEWYRAMTWWEKALEQ